MDLAIVLIFSLLTTSITLSAVTLLVALFNRNK